MSEPAKDIETLQQALINSSDLLVKARNSLYEAEHEAQMARNRLDDAHSRAVEANKKYDAAVKAVAEWRPT